MVGMNTDFFITFCKLEDLTFSKGQKFSLVVKHFI